MKLRIRSLITALLPALLLVAQNGEAKLFSARMIAAEEDPPSAVQLTDSEINSAPTDHISDETPRDVINDRGRECAPEEQRSAADH